MVIILFQSNVKKSISPIKLKGLKHEKWMQECRGNSKLKGSLGDRYRQDDNIKI